MRTGLLSIVVVVMANPLGACGGGAGTPARPPTSDTTEGGGSSTDAYTTEETGPGASGQGMAIPPREGDYALTEATVVSSTCGATRFLSPDRPEEQRRFHVRGNDIEGTVYLLLDGRGQIGTMDASIAPNEAGEPVFAYEVDGEDWSMEGGRACVLHSLASVVGRVTSEDTLTLDVTLAVSAPTAERSGPDTTFDPVLCREKLAYERGATAWDLSPCQTRYRLALERVAAP